MKSLLTFASLSLSLAAVAAPSVDFSVYAGSVRRELHSSGYAPPYYPRQDYNGDADVKAMKLHSARTHNWAIYNCAERVCDLGLVFPCADLDPADESNYYFNATDVALSLARSSNAGSMQIFYTLGNSTDYAGDKAFNGLMPTNFEHTAEVMAGVVRHYNEGWASGQKWGIKYWEIWSTPDDAKNYWYREGLTSTQLRDQFATFFATCLKKLKTEFPTCKFGGPGLSSWNTEWLTAILNACAAEGVAPDFISWHAYTNDPAKLAQQPATARAWLDNLGYTTTEIIIDEWHYLPNNSWSGITQNATSQTSVYLSHDPANSSAVWGIDSGVFNLSVLARLQYTALDRAFYYGCGYSGVGPSSTWAYFDYYGNKNKPYYSLKMFGQVASSATHLVQAASDGTVTVLGATNGDGKKGYLVVSDYKGTTTSLTVNLAGVSGGISNISAKILDKNNNEATATASYSSGKLTLKKNASGSAAFVVTFDLVPENPPHQHTWGAWTTNVAATCLKPGLATCSCTASGCTEPPATKTKDLPALDHDWSDWVVDIEPQVGVPGEMRRECRRTECDCVETQPIDPLPEPGALVTNAMANASWGYVISNPGAVTNDVALVFTNTAATMSWTLPENVTVLSYLVVGGGGGGGGYIGGGGGAGRMIEESFVACTAGATLSVKVGKGGTGSSAQTLDSGATGGDSTLSFGAVEVTAAGGGRGGYGSGTKATNGKVGTAGGAGGSGGGAGGCGSTNSSAVAVAQAGGADVGADGFGHVGGGIVGGVNSYCGAGGGGAGEAGHDATPMSEHDGVGGAGRPSAITGETLYYAAGGSGGGGSNNPVPGQTLGGGGAGGFGTKRDDRGYLGENGMSGRGSGGGGGGSGAGQADMRGGNGGSGIVVVRYNTDEQHATAHVHEWGPWTTNSTPDCVTNGSRTRTCVADGCTEPKAVQNETLPALGHDWGAWVTDVEPQIGVAGHRYRDCSRCGAHAEETIPSLPTEATTNAMANASWGYEIRGLGDDYLEVALVFTNASEAMSWTVPDGVSSFRFLVVGGGGSGGGNGSFYGAGGGGAGGVVTGHLAQVTSGDLFSVSVGAGGQQTATGSNAGNKGKDSALASGDRQIVAYGGGGGGKNAAAGAVGGSGGGSGTKGGNGGSAKAGEVTGFDLEKGVASANGYFDAFGSSGGNSSSSSNFAGAGGGGAGGAGGNGTTATDAGKGGNGIICNLTGKNVWYAGGGGGGASYNNGKLGAGGSGGGGSGGGRTSNAAKAGTNGLGGGGGGGGGASDTTKYSVGAAGGSGVVVVRYSTGGQPVPTHTHVWSEWTTNAVATCLTNGLATRVCTAAGCTEPPAVETNVLAALGHDLGEWHVTKEPGVGVAGEKSRECQREGCDYCETQVIDPLEHTHVWSEWTTNEVATCLTNGLATRVCTAPGCTEPPVAETNVLAALGHDWGAWVTDVEPQVGVAGHKYRDCTRCDAREEETLAPLQPVPTEVTTNAMANAAWGYEIRGLGAAMDEVSLVFTNTTEEAMDYPLPDGATVLRYLVAAGGGAGGASSGNDYYQSGGGGAGGLLTASDLDMGQVAKLTVSVGAGGAAVSVSGASAYKNGTNGGDSSLTLGTAEPIVAHGGGGGAGRGESTGNAGGSGGGAGVSYSTSAAAGSTILTAGVEGYAGGKSYKGQVGAGGGGGAGGAGGGYTDATKAQAGCAGGRGVTNDIAGTWAWFCAGGGGGAAGRGQVNVAGGAGGTGGGGAGARSGSLQWSANLTAGSGKNYGCGGGGAAGYPADSKDSVHTSGAGYQGVVIVRYRTGAVPQPTGKWDAVETSQVDGVTDANKAAVEATLDAIQAALRAGATAADVAGWLTTVYGNQKVAAATLAEAKHVGLSVKYDLPLLVSETPTVTVEVSSDPVSETGVAAFVFTIKDGDTPVSVTQAKVQAMVQYAATLAGGFAPSTAAEVAVTPDGTAIRAELQRVEGRSSGFMKIELNEADE